MFNDVSISFTVDFTFSISLLSSCLRHDSSDFRLPKRVSIRDSKWHNLSIMLPSETWSSSLPGVPSWSERFGDGWYCEEDELEERVSHWFHLDIVLKMIIWSQGVYIAASVPFWMMESERYFSATVGHHALPSPPRALFFLEATLLGVWSFYLNLLWAYRKVKIGGDYVSKLLGFLSISRYLFTVSNPGKNVHTPTSRLYPDKKYTHQSKFSFFYLVIINKLKYGLIFTE